MALDIDGFAVLRAIAANEAMFAEISADVTEFARKLVAAQLKDTSTDLARLRDIRAALGGENLALVLDSFPDAQIRALLTKIDKHRSEIKTSGAAYLRAHFNALLDGSIAPTAKSAPAKKASTKAADAPSAPSKKKARDPNARLEYRSAGAQRQHKRG